MWEAELGLLGPQLPPPIPGAVGAEGPGSGRRHPRLTDDCDISSHSGRRERLGWKWGRSLGHLVLQPTSCLAIRSHAFVSHPLVT